MGVIELLDGFYIEVDPLNYTLKQRYSGSTRDGGERAGTRIHGYFPKLESALKRFCELERLEEIKGRRISLYEYTGAIVRADKKVMEFLAGLNLEERRHDD